ncbi:MAG: glycosyltransferase family 2 protein [Lachnospiraceae bacterium]
MIDVVIPVYKPEKSLFNKVLVGLAKQSRKPENLILMLTVTGDSHEWERLRVDVKGILESNGAPNIEVEVHPIDKNDYYHGRTRNRGVAYSRAPYVLLMTQDAIPSDTDLLEKLMDILEMNPDVSQVYARQAVDENAPDYIRYTQEFNYPEIIQIKTKDSYSSLGIKAIFCSNVCCMYRKDIFDYLGGFEDRVIFNEDMIYARKALDAGYTIVYEGNAYVTHYHKYSCKQQFQRNFDLATSQKMNSEAFEGLSSTSEGKKMVGIIFKKLWKNGKYGTALYYIVLSASKYMGYLLGKQYNHIPYGLRKRFSSNPSFWREG